MLATWYNYYKCYYVRHNSWDLANTWPHFTWPTVFVSNFGIIFVEVTLAIKSLRTGPLSMVVSMMKTRLHASMYWHQSKYQLWANCFMRWVPVANRGHRNLYRIQIWSSLCLLICEYGYRTDWKFSHGFFQIDLLALKGPVATPKMATKMREISWYFANNAFLLDVLTTSHKLH